MAVFAPMPSASDNTATAVNTGDFLKDRSANLRSFDAEAINVYRLRRLNPVGLRNTIQYFSVVKRLH